MRRDCCCCRVLLLYCYPVSHYPCAMVCTLAEEVEHTGGAKFLEDVRKAPERGVEFCKSLPNWCGTLVGAIAVLFAAALVIVFVVASLNKLKPG